jgi:hypothetical protein
MNKQQFLADKACLKNISLGKYNEFVFFKANHGKLNKFVQFFHEKYNILKIFFEI